MKDVLRSTWLRSAASLAIGVAAWQVVATFVTPNSLFVVPFSDVAIAEYKWFADGTIWYHLYVSGLEFAAGFALATVVGIAMGAVIGISRSADALISPWVALMYSTPLVAITPLYILVFGIDLASKIALVFTIVVFTISVNTSAGFAAAESKYVELARAYGASQRHMVMKVLFPSALPFILTGLKLASGRAIIGVVVGEFFAARAGIGFLVSEAGTSFQMARLYAGVMILSIAGLLLFRFFDLLGRRLTPWREAAPL